MSTNVTGFQVRKMHEFTVPLHFFLQPGFEFEFTETSQRITITGEPEALELVGVLQGDRILVHEFAYGGEGSGSMWELYKEMFERTTGELQAIVVWEGGDTLERLAVKDGVVTSEELL